MQFGRIATTLRILCLLVGMMFSVPAFAEKVIVKDHVTLREGPSRSANILGYPVIGTVFDLSLIHI